MTAIVKEYAVTGTRSNDLIRARYDPESRDSLVSRDVAERLGNVGCLPSKVTVNANGVDEALRSCGSIHFGVDLDNVRVLHHFYVVDALPEEMFIGADMIRKWRISLDPDNETVTIDPCAEDLNRRTGIAIAVPVSGE